MNHQNIQNVNTNYELQKTGRMDFEIKSGCNGLRFSAGNSENTAATLNYYGHENGQSSSSAHFVTILNPTFLISSPVHYWAD
jgi:hypothetical protein